MVIEASSPWPGAAKTHRPTSRRVYGRSLNGAIDRTTMAAHRTAASAASQPDPVAIAHGSRFGRIEILAPNERSAPESTRSEALALLKRAAVAVSRIMQRRGWHVPILREFYPQSPVLLGLNVGGGAEIRIRLAHHGDPRNLLPYDDIVGTLLHELVHIARGPHDKVFYATLAELNAELDTDIKSGWQAIGFDAPGNRLGPPPTLKSGIPITPEQRRLLALTATERRLQRASLTREPIGGHRLGSVSNQVRNTLPAAEMARLAAQLRARDMERLGNATQYTTASASNDSDTKNIIQGVETALEDIERDAQKEAVDQQDYIVYDNSDDNGSNGDNSSNDDDDNDDNDYRQDGGSGDGDKALLVNASGIDVKQERAVNDTTAAVECIDVSSDISEDGGGSGNSSNRKRPRDVGIKEDDIVWLD